MHATHIEKRPISRPYILEIDLKSGNARFVLSFSSFKTYRCPAGPIFKLGLEFSVGTPSRGGGGGGLPGGGGVCGGGGPGGGGGGGGGADALGLLVIWGAHAATCGVQKVAAREALEGPGWHL